MLSEGKIALQSLAKRLREWGPSKVPEGWRSKLGELHEKGQENYKKASFELDKRRLWLAWHSEWLWTNGLFRAFVYGVIIWYVVMG